MVRGAEKARGQTERIPGGDSFGGRKLAALMNWSWLAGSKLLQYGLGFPVGVLNAWILGPSTLGILKVIQTLSSYAVNSDLGLTKVFIREVPILRGKGDEAGANRLRDIVFTESLISTLIVVFVMWIGHLAGWHLGGALSPIWIMILTSVILLVGRIGVFMDAYLVAEGLFVLQSHRRILVAVIGPFISVPLVLLFRLPGALLALILNSLVSIVAIVWSSRPRLKVAISWSETRRRLRDGLSLFFLNLSGKFFWSIELLIIPVWLSLGDVGIYGFALGGIKLARMIPASFHNIVYRSMAVDHGENQSQDSSYLRKYMSAPWAGHVLLSSLCLGGVFFVYKFLVTAFLHEYVTSLPVLFVLAIGVAMHQSGVFSSFALNVLGEFDALIFVKIIALIVNVALDLLLMSQFGVIGAALGSSLTYILTPFVFMLLVFRRIYERGTSQALKTYSKLVVTISLSMGSVFAFYRLSETGLSFPTQPLWLMVGARMSWLVFEGVVFTVWCIIIFTMIFREYKLWRELQFAIRHLGKSLSLSLRGLGRERLDWLNRRLFAQ